MGIRDAKRAIDEMWRDVAGIRRDMGNMPVRLALRDDDLSQYIDVRVSHDSFIGAGGNYNKQRIRFEQNKRFGVFRIQREEVPNQFPYNSGKKIELHLYCYALYYDLYAPGDGLGAEEIRFSVRRGNRTFFENTITYNNRPYYPAYYTIRPESGTTAGSWIVLNMPQNDGVYYLPDRYTEIFLTDRGDDPYRKIVNCLDSEYMRGFSIYCNAAGAETVDVFVLSGELTLTINGGAKAGTNVLTLSDEANNTLSKLVNQINGLGDWVAELIYYDGDASSSLLSTVITSPSMSYFNIDPETNIAQNPYDMEVDDDDNDRRPFFRFYLNEDWVRPVL